MRGALLERKRARLPRIVATGRDSWGGWVELKCEQIADAPIANTAFEDWLSSGAPLNGYSRAQRRVSDQHECLFEQDFSPEQHTLMLRGCLSVDTCA